MCWMPSGVCFRFLSTPSARRATSDALKGRSRCQHFYPRPPRGGRPEKLTVDRFARAISIHALREEGDSAVRFKTQRRMTFLSTPSARRATRLR